MLSSSIAVYSNRTDKGGICYGAATSSSSSASTLGLRGILSGVAKVSSSASKRSTSVTGNFIIDATGPGLPMISAAIECTIEVPGLTAGISAAYSSECQSAGNSMSGWVEFDLPGIITQRLSGSGVQHCTPTAPFRHKFSATVEEDVEMLGGALQLSGLTVEMTSSATNNNVRANFDDPTNDWSGTVTGDLSLEFGDALGGGLYASVEAGATAQFELSMQVGNKHVSFGDVKLRSALHVQYGDAAAPMFEADVRFEYTLSGTNSHTTPMSGVGSLILRLPIDSADPIVLTAAAQIFPEGVPISIKAGRSVVLSGRVAGGVGNDGATDATNITKVGTYAVSNMRVGAVAYTLADRMDILSMPVDGTITTASMSNHAVAAIIAGSGLNLADYGVSIISIIDVILASAGQPAAIQTGVFDLFYKPMSIASKLATETVPLEQFTVDMDSVIEVLTWLGSADTDSLSRLDDSIADVLLNYDAGELTLRELKDAVMSYIIITETLAEEARVDLDRYGISNSTYADVLRQVASNAKYDASDLNGDDALVGTFSGYLFTDENVQKMLPPDAKVFLTELSMTVADVAETLRSSGNLSAAIFQSVLKEHSMTSEGVITAALRAMGLDVTAGGATGAS